MPNPICSCLVTSPPPSTPCDSNCIYAPNLLVADQVTACVAIATDINISPVTAICSTPATYSIISSKNVTGTPTITSTKITFIPANNNYASGEITYKVSCGILSAIGKVIIVYKNNCVGISCPTNQVCNKCTGACQNLSIDLSGQVAAVIPPVNTSGFVI